VMVAGGALLGMELGFAGYLAGRVGWPVCLRTRRLCVQKKGIIRARWKRVSAGVS